MVCFFWRDRSDHTAYAKHYGQLKKEENDMRIYKLSLWNKSEKLDLRKNEDQIKKVLSMLVSDNKKDVSNANILKLAKSYLVLEVIESRKFWHQSFGKNLKNDFGLYNFCDSKNPNRMFKWDFQK
ncbi:MAG: hypothetical protein DRO16_01940 [Thermoprotei archaeon]|nr:MAG: hypothetical protein DRO16_01940 [Thermoprotei archaeon]